MHKPVIINFTKDELDAFIKDENSCVTINNSTYSIPLYPYHLSNVSESIKRLLNAKVAKYDQRLDGILLGYKNLKLITPYASLRADSCYIHVDIQGDFYIFKPKIGAKLIGVVNKTSSSHIGCLVHKVFNVSVSNKNENEQWSDLTVKIGNTVELSVTETQLDARLPFIRASIISSNKNKSETIEAENEETDGSPKKQKKKKTQSNETSDIDNKIELLLQETAANLNGSPKKHKKKRLSQQTENNVETTEEIPNHNESPKKQKKKQHSQEQPENNNVEPSPEDSNKKQKKKNRNSDKIDNLDIKVEELSQKTLILNESQKKQKKKRQSQDEPGNLEKTTDTNKITPKKQISSESQRTNESDYFATPKIKKKQKPHKETNKEEPAEVIVEKGSLEDFVPKEKKSKKRNSKKIESETIDTNSITNTKTDSAKKKKKKQNDAIDSLDVLPNTLLIKQLQSYTDSKKDKKSKSKEIKFDMKSMNLTPVKPMADLEDRKTKKRRQSISQNVDWENKELNLYDSDLEKTLNASSNTNKMLEESLEFNLAKIQALNDNTPRKRKRKLKQNTENDFVQTFKKKTKIMEED